jgi:hypothetical protein
VCCDFLFCVDAVGVGLCVIGVVDQTSTTDGVGGTVCVWLAKVGTEYAEEGIATRAWAAELLLTPAMINGRAIGSTTVAPITNARRVQ